MKKADLLKEIEELRRRVAELEARPLTPRFLPGPPPYAPQTIPDPMPWIAPQRMWWQNPVRSGCITSDQNTILYNGAM